MFQYIVLACILVCILAIIYWICFRRTDEQLRSSSIAEVQRSNGTFDARARSALVSLTQIDNPTPGDRFRRANIIHYNVLEGRYNNHAAVGTMVRDYADALLGMNAREPGADFMIHRIEDLHLELHDTVYEDDDIIRLIMGFDNIVQERAPVLRQNIIEERVQAAAEHAETRAEHINNYFNAAVTHTNDSQNVHDSKVNKDLRDALGKMRATAGLINPQRSISEASDYISNVYACDEFNVNKVQHARAVLVIVSRGDIISTYNESESNIFAIVWERCKHENNSKNAELMRESVINALADSIEQGAPVCINGRCARVLNSLTKLDYDKSISEQGAMTFEAYKNQIFQETKQIINDAIENGKRSSDLRIRNVANAYNGAPTDDIDPESDQTFKNDIKTEITRNIQCYADKLNTQEIAGLLEESYVFATL